MKQGVGFLWSTIAAAIIVAIIIVIQIYGPGRIFGKTIKTVSFLGSDITRSAVDLALLNRKDSCSRLDCCSLDTPENPVEDCLATICMKLVCKDPDGDGIKDLLPESDWPNLANQYTICTEHECAKYHCEEHECDEVSS